MGWLPSARLDEGRPSRSQSAHGNALYAAVCEHGLEGVVARKLSDRYRPRSRNWVELKNPNYWRRDSEIEATQRSRERRRAVKPATAVCPHVGLR
jgi:ATP-dependent DNA ligase